METDTMIIIIIIIPVYDACFLVLEGLLLGTTFAFVVGGELLLMIAGRATRITD
ncbi:hypothetical protein A2U01_0081698 [Trifolium medium]|uniref:Uncharacterized protein n=1 Tax=Trifolium medium TaxID=97028 RepID=A0A392THL3_9FABA|nr:hypothetical protein [Trifolium medium]